MVRETHKTVDTDCIINGKPPPTGDRTPSVPLKRFTAVHHHSGTAVVTPDVSSVPLTAVHHHSGTALVTEHLWSAVKRYTSTVARGTSLACYDEVSYELSHGKVSMVERKLAPFIPGRVVLEDVIPVEILILISDVPSYSLCMGHLHRYISTPLQLQPGLGVEEQKGQLQTWIMYKNDCMPCLPRLPSSH